MRYSSIRGLEISKREIKPASSGLVSRPDGTPARCYRVGLGPGSSEIISRQLTAVLGDGSMGEFAPNFELA